jgi:hypothetical protein
MKGFVDLDDSILKTALDTSRSKEAFQDKVKKLAPAYAGSCALLYPFMIARWTASFGTSSSFEAGLASDNLRRTKGSSCLVQ